LFLFKLIDESNKTVRRYLHTGDFRACPKQVLHPAIAKLSDPIDMLYLDTTYLNSRYCFPAQEQVVKAVVSLIGNAIKKGGLVPVSTGRTSRKKAMARDPSQMALDTWFKSANRKQIGEQENVVTERKESYNKNGESVHEDKKSNYGGDNGVSRIHGTTLSESKLLVVVGTYLIGKEKIFIGMLG
jgi:DNA cross-link repair 1A protein